MNYDKSKFQSVCYEVSSHFVVYIESLFIYPTQVPICSRNLE